MTAVNRRRLFAWSALLGAGAAMVSRARAEPRGLNLKDLRKEAEINVAYHCDFGQPERYSAMLRNINNHLSVYGFDPFLAKIVIVAHGPGVKFFLKDLAGTPWEKETLDPELAARFEGLGKYGVEALLCQITFQNLKIDKARIRDDAGLRMVPSGVATVAELQLRGYAYVKVG